MRFTSWMMFLLAMAVVGAAGAMVVRQKEQRPADLLAEVEALLSRGSFDERTALSRLERALTRAAAEGDEELCTRVLETRADLYQKLGAKQKARADLERMLTEYLPRDLKIQERLIGLDLETGAFDEGLVRAHRYQEEAPEHGAFWGLSARLQIARGEALEEQCDGLLSQFLVERGLADAGRLARRIAAMDARDPLRVSKVHLLRSLFSVEDDPAATQILNWLDEASLIYAAARSDLARRFADDDFEPELVGLFLDLLIDVERLEEAVDVGLFASAIEGVLSNERTALLLVRGLCDLGRFNLARRCSAPTLDGENPLGQNFGPAFYIEVCRAYYGYQRWGGLSAAANSVMADGDFGQHMIGQWYMGMALTGLFRVQYDLEKFTRDRALMQVDRYLTHPVAEPFEGARALAQLTKSELIRGGREEGRTEVFTEEALREALAGALALDRDADGELWLELSRLQEQRLHGGYENPLGSWTQAMCKLPARSAELIEPWRELGEKAIAGRISIKNRMKILLRAQQDEQNSGWIPPVRLNSYELFRIAESWRDGGEPYGTISAVTELLEEHPEFLPALELLIEAHLELTDYPAAAERALQHLELVGPTEENLATLGRIPADILTPKQILRRMRADPEHFGRSNLVRHLAATGRGEEALGGLMAAGVTELDEEQRLLTAALMVQLDRGDLASMLVHIDPASSDPRSCALRLQILLRGQEASLLDPSELDSCLLEVEGADRAWVLEQAQLLMRFGHVRKALSLLERIDESRSSDGQVLVQMAIAQAMLGELRAAQKSADRAEAFLSGASVPKARVMIAIAQERWRSLPRLVDKLRDAAPVEDELEDALLAILEGRPERAHALLEAEIEDGDPDDLWYVVQAALAAISNEEIVLPAHFGPYAETLENFFHGTPDALADEPRNLRSALGSILGLLDRDWCNFAVAELEGLTPERAGLLWPNYLSAFGLARLGEERAATTKLRAMTGWAPKFGPTWHDLIELERRRLGRDDHPELIALRALRREQPHMGPLLADEPGILAYEDALASIERGQLEAALESAEPGAAAGYGPALRQKAHILFLQDQLEAAREAFETLLAQATEAELEELVPEYLRLLERAHSRSPSALPNGDLEAALAELAERLPRDPLIPLSQARSALRNDPLNPELAVGHAYAELDDFRDRTDQVAIESLREGATAAWSEFYSALDPEQAEAFLRRELALVPGSIELRYALADVLATRGEIEEEMALLKVVTRMLPSPDGFRRLGAAARRAAWDPAEVERLLKHSHRLTGSSEADPRLNLLLAQSLVNQATPESAQRALRYVEPLWERRAMLATLLPIEDLATVYAKALLARDQGDDWAVAHSILERTVRLVEDPYGRPTLQALANLVAVQSARRR